MSWQLYERAMSLLSEEIGAVKKPFGGKVTVAIAYPNTYEIGMSNLGFQKIYHLLNCHNDILCERVFLPSHEDIIRFKKEGIPLFSLESQTPVCNFDIVAFSVTFESDYINILKILELSHIPIKSIERNERHPLILMGGICATSNPEPLSDFIDIFFIGEGDEAVDEFVGVLRSEYDKRRNGKTLYEFYLRLAAVNGIYIPSAYKIIYDKSGVIKEMLPGVGFPQKVKRRWVKDLNKTPTSSRLLTRNTVFGDMYLIETGRGCGKNCRFCLAGYTYRPPRNYSAEVILKEVSDGLGYRKKIGLVGSAICDNPHIEEICEGIKKAGGIISISSLRLDKLSKGLIDFLSVSGHRTATIAPEAGSERLRKAINKEMSDDKILEAVQLIASAGIPNFKLYFLIGLPTETEEDIEAIVSLSKRIKHSVLKTGRDKRHLGNITLSINPFIPKPSTSYQWEKMDDIASLNRKIKKIKSGLKGVSNINIIHELPKWSFVQALLSRGDRRVGELLLRCHQLDGDWFRTFRETNINPDFYVYREREFNEVLPWDLIDTGIKKEFFIREAKKNREGVITPSCPEKGECRMCGDFGCL
ncbi:MAG: hypothetical protein A2Z59_08085 [Nitrospinae bacterium RIFCSPLOWO2_02_39_17]|nr:MAG: hypothetical protein A2W53_04940 [Nitrospinae bacterium RIFCSPHIGHO2_02_39_11]OGV99024.1 MAG: hypothetical protein A3D97_06185 [Nitrospinae bacterium RIFCSPHIGHO2_12_FULL_39_42]OGW04727.1 MAG: hypothetical protein A2Z59_08085 [Nitrospinae bacterium RIFCSPLOWO2_02_39_17]OGW10434.1 MAG: hypothetical protein A2W75_10560 [Nitrospinae bacterium RIFCSPLOWO2_12_39_15]